MLQRIPAQTRSFQSNERQSDATFSLLPYPVSPALKRLAIYFQCGVHGGCLIKLADKGGERRGDIIGCQYLSRLLR